MRLPEFAMERLQSRHEKLVRFDLSESGVEALTLTELGVDAERLLSLPLGYADGRGDERLRALVAAFHPGADAEHVLITSGTSEANHLALATLLEPGDRAVIVMPTYLQARGLALGLGAEVREVRLREERGWTLDLDELAASVGAPGETKVISLCQPNNPTAQRLSSAEVAAVARIATDAGAWIHSDEVFRGAERTGEESTSFSGTQARTIVTGGLSKAYGLPGLRVGWIVAPPDRVEAAWAMKDYLTIAASTLSLAVAESALARREALVARARGLARERWPALEAWLWERPGLRWTPPSAGTFCLVRYPADVPSEALVRRLIGEGQTLAIPGAHFGAEGTLRIGFGMAPEVLHGGLDALAAALAVKEAG